MEQFNVLEARVRNAWKPNASEQRPPELSWATYIPNACEFTALPSGALVIDVGSGSGIQLRELRQRGCNAIGIDPDWVSLLRCRKQGLKVVKAAAEAMPFKDSSADGMVFKVVAPYTDERRALQEIARVLKPGGVCDTVYHGAGYYVRYLICGPGYKFRFYGLRSLVNTWFYVVSKGRRLPGWLGDTIYQSRRRLTTLYANNGLRLPRDSAGQTFLGHPVFIYHTLRKVRA